MSDVTFQSPLTSMQQYAPLSEVYAVSAAVLAAGGAPYQVEGVLAHLHMNMPPNTALDAAIRLDTAMRFAGVIR